MVSVIVVLFFLLDILDVVLLAKAIEDLHKHLKALHQVSKNYELIININKTKIMIYP
jgi:hypothetical protein